MPKILGSTLAEHRSVTRERVFSALVELLQERPFDAITMADLAAVSGIGRSALYNHFKDSEAVVVAFACEETDAYLRDLRQALGDLENPAERLECYVRHHVAATKRFHLGFGPELMGMLSADAAHQLRGHVRAVQAVLRQILCDGIESGEFAPGDVAGMVGLIHATLGAKNASADTTARFVLAAVSAETRA